MMAQSTSFIALVAALLISTLSYCSAENVYCVTPTATSCSFCPHNTHCATLSEYAQEAELYFTSNTTMVFLPGDHLLDRTITIDNVTRLTMHLGDSSSGNMATVVNNCANGHGRAIYAKTKTLLKFTGISDFITNNATSGGAISAHDYVVITFTGTIRFISNSAMQGGAISANRNSKLTFDGNISYTNNGHDNTNADNGVSHGGAIYLALNSTFSLLPHTTVCWENNHATLGGAIYVSDTNPLIYCTQIAQYIAAYVPREECFFQLPGQGLFNGIYVNLLFKNNSADDAGSVLYGGAIDNCKLHLTGLDPYFSSGHMFDMLFQYEDDTDYSTTSKIASDPIY